MNFGIALHFRLLFIVSLNFTTRLCFSIEIRTTEKKRILNDNKAYERLFTLWNKFLYVWAK